MAQKRLFRDTHRRPSRLRTTGLALGLVLFLSAAPALAQRYYMEPLKVSPAQLMEAYQRDFHSADAMYTGKLLLVTGRIKTIRPPQRSHYYHYDKLYAYLTLDTGNNQPLAVYFWDWEAQGINFNPNMRNGVTITVMGFCQGVTPQLSLREACIYPRGCGGPKKDFDGPYYELPPSPPAPPRPRRR